MHSSSESFLLWTTGFVFVVYCDTSVRVFVLVRVKWKCEVIVFLLHTSKYILAKTTYNVHYVHFEVIPTPNNVG